MVQRFEKNQGGTLSRSEEIFFWVELATIVGDWDFDPSVQLYHSSTLLDIR